MTKSGDLTNISHHLKLLSLVQRLRYVHHSQAAPISYTFLVCIADNCYCENRPAKHYCSGEVSSAKGLSLRGNPLRLYRAKH